MKTLFVPALSLDLSLLNRLADSIDWPIEKKVALNNGPENALESFGESHPDWMVIDSPTGNKGVADSWNYCAKLFPNESAFLLCNEDCWFLPGQLEKICSTSDHNIGEPIIYLNSSQAFYCFVWHAAGREQFGEFDANFFPAYYEDCDYRVRMRLAGKTDFVYALEGQPVVPHGKPRTGGVNYAALINGCGLLNRAYWLRKWGSMSMEQAAYPTPYRDHRLTAKDWVWYPEHRAELFPLWRSFLEQNPSIYD